MSVGCVHLMSGNYHETGRVLPMDFVLTFEYTLAKILPIRASGSLESCLSTKLGAYSDVSGRPWWSSSRLIVVYNEPIYQVQMSANSSFYPFEVHTSECSVHVCGMRAPDEWQLPRNRSCASYGFCSDIRIYYLQKSCLLGPPGPWNLVWAQNLVHIQMFQVAHGDRQVDSL